jgi:16S rRNA (guanine527-N7)-methyltransferase
MKNPEFSPNGLWSIFAEREQLTQAQLKQFQHYYTLLTTWNQRINLTRIIELPDVLNYHFSDSLRFGDCLPDSEKSVSLVDVGSGAGFPGIPLAIKYPHFTITLLEVTQKKVIFLQEIIAVLGLANVTIDTRDWRTYMHHVHDPLDYVCARASLQVPELMRIFQEGPRFAHTQVVYWASQQWELPAEYASSLVRDYDYVVGEKKRRLIFLKQLTRSVRKG